MQLGDEVRNETKLVWALVWPIILSNLLHVSVGMIDFKMVGSLGIGAIAAVGMAQHVMMLVMVVMIAIGGGTSVLVAHAHGAGNRRRVSEVASRSMGLLLLTAVLVVMPVGLLSSEGMMRLLGGEPGVVRVGAAYLNILFWGALFHMSNMGVSAILLGVGETRISLWLLLGVNGANVGLNYLLIYGVGPFPALGVNGAALGTVLAHGLGFLVGLWILASPRFLVAVEWRDVLTLDLALARRILYLGGPRSLQGIVRNLSRLLTIRIITLLPEAKHAVGAYSVAMQTRMISSFIGLAFMSAAMSRVGQNLGRGDPQAAVHSGWISAGIAAAMMTVVAAVFLLVPEQIMTFFTDDTEAIRLGRGFFVTIALTEPVLALSFALGGALRGGGDPVSPFVWASVSDLGVVTAVGYLLAVPCGWGFAGIAAAIAISSLTHAIPTTWIFHRGAWKTNRL